LTKWQVDETTQHPQHTSNYKRWTFLVELTQLTRKCQKI